MDVIQDITLIFSNLSTPILLSLIAFLYVKKEKERDKRLEKIENQVSNHLETEIKELHKKVDSVKDDFRKEMQDVRKELTNKIDSNYKEQQKTNTEILKVLAQIKGYLQGKDEKDNTNTNSSNSSFA